ncbi:MAG: signal recognition particle protein [Bacteroidales bacterium]
MFENLTDRMERSLKVLKGQGKITDINIAETMKEVRRSLLDADVSYKIAKTFCNSVKEKALGQNVIKSVNPQQMMVKIVHDELTALMGTESVDINIQGKKEGDPGIILVSGLQGSGKTTFCGKLALNLKKKKNKKVMMIAGDIYRPAAIEQLKVLGEQVGATVYSEESLDSTDLTPDRSDNTEHTNYTSGVGTGGSKDPVAITKRGIEKARKEGYNLIIVDTAGRLAVDEQMMGEIAAIKNAINPSETLFVVDAMTGQDAVETAKTFNDRLDFDGVVLTKMDGDTRGGAALSVKSVVDKPIKFISSGEKMEALDVFHPKRIADRILGMGDVVSLVEKAEEQINEEEARKLHKKIVKNQFTLDDFYKQIQQIKKMGNIKDLASMIPGVGKAIKDVDIDNNSFKGVEAIILSMTPDEKEHPEIINGSRRRRIAAGSGTSIAEVNRLLKQFNDTRKMMKTVATGGARGAMKNMRRNSRKRR